MQDWPPQEMRQDTRKDAPTPALRLLAAIAVDDHAAFQAALPEIADLNADKGQFLRAAADARNMLFMKELALAGADIPYATAEAERERGAIRQDSYWDDYIHDFVTQFSSTADKRRHQTLGHTISTLQQFQKTYTAHIAPAESLKLQQRILAEIETLTHEITEMRDGKPLEKPALRPRSAKNTPE